MDSEKRQNLVEAENTERIRLIENEIALAWTFLGMAQTEKGLDDAQVRPLISKARSAYDAVTKFLGPVISDAERKRLEGQRRELGEAIEATERSAPL